ncbi:AhpD family alkylhydroperoxidase [Luteibacter rhizovicinus]|uniref:AhpD family alkylhydroperoxidase n=1 Tax=Luteibacter rhizovicinus TaxID=242606 RepID=A0A4R3YKU4_9GAMM|nr:carboxymuconolactone decarboxylase family protein [Luteibacter rhizovicinus]TCV92886.1 AhpD family alkylhydroperoxidase [Luteibacter rhizovicinus]
MQARQKNPAVAIPDAMKALMALTAVTRSHGSVPGTTLDLIELRASQINGCGVCVHMHSRMARKAGETDDRLFSLAGWRDTPYFNDAERAALALTEAVTRINDRPDAVSDDIWNEATRHYDEAALSVLLLAIANINVWNRLNVATRQVASSWLP